MATIAFAELFACGFRPFVAAAVLANCAVTSTPANSPSGARDEATSRLAYAAEALATVDSLDEHRIPSQVAERARCVAVVPGLVSGALVIGAKHGRGVVTCRSDGGWSSPAFFTLSGGTAGFEVGLQSVDVVMLALTDGGKRAFLVPELQLGGDASASAGPEGRGRSEDTDPSLRAAIVSYSSNRGFFAGVALSGAVIHQDPEAARALYGRDESPATLLRTPATRGTPADPFLARVRTVFGG
jgi:lipid-binding SYLF domain-containing protein